MVMVVVAVIPRVIIEPDPVINIAADLRTAAVGGFATGECPGCKQKCGGQSKRKFARVHVSGLLSTFPPAIP
jgi:hypothetical protein